MIYTSCKVTIKNFEAKVERPIILYRGDKNVEVQFEIVESIYKQYKISEGNVINDLRASFGQLVILKPDGVAIFSEITNTLDGKVIFTIPPTLIDESNEVGEFTFQIRLFDESQSSRVTLPPVEGGIIIEEPIASES